MRNHVALLLCALSLSLMLTGCNSSQANSLSTNASVSSAPAEQPVTPSPTPSSIPSPAPSPTLEPSNWGIKSSVDKFGDDTGHPYVLGSFQGTFSNSATMGSDLKVYVFYVPNPGWFIFRLFEYGNSPITLYTSDVANLEMKIDDEVYGAELQFVAGDLILSPRYSDANATLKAYNGTDREVFYKTLLASLRRGDTISCYISIDDFDDWIATLGGSGSQYNFKISGIGFAEQEATISRK